MGAGDPSKFSVVAAAFGAAGMPIAPDRADALERFIALLVKWSRRINLTAVRDPPQIAEVHLLDAALVAQGLAAGDRLVDVGSGAGLPGLVVAVLRPDARVTLVEPVAKKVAFLRAAVEATGAHDVEVLRARDGDLPQASWDRAVSRATFPPDEWLPIGLRLVGPGGQVALMVADESKLPPGAASTRRIVLPTSGAIRIVGWYCRAAEPLP